MPAKLTVDAKGVCLIAATPFTDEGALDPTERRYAHRLLSALRRPRTDQARGATGSLQERDLSVALRQRQALPAPAGDVIGAIGKSGLRKRCLSGEVGRLRISLKSRQEVIGVEKDR